MHAQPPIKVDRRPQAVLTKSLGMGSYLLKSSAIRSDPNPCLPQAALASKEERKKNSSSLPNLEHDSGSSGRLSIASPDPDVKPEFNDHAWQLHHDPSTNFGGDYVTSAAESYKLSEPRNPHQNFKVLDQMNETLLSSGSQQEPSDTHAICSD